MPDLRHTIRGAIGLALVASCLGCSEPEMLSVGYTLRPALPARSPSPAPADAVAPTSNATRASKAKPPLPSWYCRLPDGEGDSLYFATDSFALEPPSETTLNHVAACLIRGPLSGDHITLVGYADPRGSVEYNSLLALRRAEATRAYLVRAGVPTSVISVASRGKSLAQGLGPESWDYDRRVEIVLGKAKPDQGHE